MKIRNKNKIKIEFENQNKIKQKYKNKKEWLCSAQIWKNDRSKKKTCFSVLRSQDPTHSTWSSLIGCLKILKPKNKGKRQERLTSQKKMGGKRKVE